MKIKSLQDLCNHESYIKEKCHLVRDVYTCAIYFYNGSYHSLQWDVGGVTPKEIQELYLRMINAACNTDFELEENGGEL